MTESPDRSNVATHAANSWRWLHHALAASIAIGATSLAGAEVPSIPESFATRSSALSPRAPSGASSPTSGLPRGGTACPVEIDFVSPDSGSEGDLFVIAGSGFDTDARNACVLLGRTGRATVIDATPTELLCEIGAVAEAESGDVKLLLGEGQVLPATFTDVGGTLVEWPEPMLLEDAIPFNTQVNFTLTAVTSSIDKFTVMGGSLAGTITGGVAAGGQIKIDIHLRCTNGYWIEIVGTGTAPSALTPTGVADHVRKYINDNYLIAGISAGGGGPFVSVSKAGGLTSASVGWVSR